MARVSTRGCAGNIVPGCIAYARVGARRARWRAKAGGRPGSRPWGSPSRTQDRGSGADRNAWLRRVVAVQHSRVSALRPDVLCRACPRRLIRRRDRYPTGRGNESVPRMRSTPGSRDRPTGHGVRFPGCPANSGMARTGDVSGSRERSGPLRRHNCVARPMYWSGAGRGGQCVTTM